MSEGAARSAGSRLQTAAYVLACSIVAAPALAALFAQAVLHQLNPRGVDVAHPDAYAIEVVVVLAVGALAMMIATAQVFSRFGREAGRAALRYPYLIVQLQVGFTVAAIALILLTPGFAAF